MRHYKGGEHAGYVNSFSINVNPEKVVKTITFESTAETITARFSSYIADKESGSDRVVYVPVTINGASDEYNYYLHTTRSCASSGIFAMTLTNKQTWLDRIATVEAKI